MGKSDVDVGDGPTAEPKTCQYHLCSEPPDAALDFYFGVRWYCMSHYSKLVQEWEQTDGPEPHRTPGS